MLSPFTSDVEAAWARAVCPPRYMSGFGLLGVIAEVAGVGRDKVEPIVGGVVRA